MGACCSSGLEGRAHGYSSAHSSRHGPTTNATGYQGFSAHEKPAIPDFGVSSAFEVQRLLGEGGTGQTWLCRDYRSGQQAAIKFIKRPIPRVVLPMVKHEVQIQAGLGDGHMNLVNAREVLLSRSHLGIVLQYAAGGNLTQYVSDRWSTTDKRNGLFIDEDEARFLFKQFLSAVEYLHHHHVAHRDLKLDNIVLTDDMPPRIKICDFGFAKNWDATSNMFTTIGTPVYMSPELISSKRLSTGYDAPKAEVWACGVLLFVMLLGMFPFDHEKNPDPNSSQAQVEVWMEQTTGNWRENPRVATAIKRLSPECCDLLDKIFVLEGTKRITVADIKKHSWYTTPLSPRFQMALDALGAEQAKVDELYRGGHYESEYRDLALETLLERAGVAPASDERPLERIQLAKVQRNYSILSHLSSGVLGMQSVPSSGVTSPLPKLPSSRISELFATGPALSPSQSSAVTAAPVAACKDASPSTAPPMAAAQAATATTLRLPTSTHANQPYGVLHGCGSIYASADASSTGQSGATHMSGSLVRHPSGVCTPRTTEAGQKVLMYTSDDNSSMGSAGRMSPDGDGVPLTSISEVARSSLAAIASAVVAAGSSKSSAPLLLSPTTPVAVPISARS